MLPALKSGSLHPIYRSIEVCQSHVVPVILSGCCYKPETAPQLLISSTVPKMIMSSNQWFTVMLRSGHSHEQKVSTAREFELHCRCSAVFFIDINYLYCWSVLIQSLFFTPISDMIMYVKLTLKKLYKLSGALKINHLLFKWKFGGSLYLVLSLYHLVGYI